MKLTEFISLVDHDTTVYVSYLDRHMTFGGTANNIAESFANGTSTIPDGEIAKVKPALSPLETFVYLLIEVTG